MAKEKISITAAAELIASLLLTGAWGDSEVIVKEIEESQKLKYAVKLAKLGYSITIEDTIDVISAVKKQNGNLFKDKEI